MMKLDVVKINPEGDGVTAVYIDGNLYTYGDYYHNKIDDWVRGFIDGLQYANATVQITHWFVAGSTKLSREVCENGVEPPGLLEEYPKKQLKKS